MSWKQYSLIKKGFVIGCILFILSVGYLGVIRIILNLSEEECGYKGKPSFHGSGYCTYESIPSYVLFSTIIFGIPLLIISTLFGYILEKIKSKK